MASKADVFAAEIGQYLELVDVHNPVGVCEHCMTIRSRNDVDGTEACPVSILATFGTEVPATKHTWTSFTARADLEKYFRENFERFTDVVERAEALFN